LSEVRMYISPGARSRRLTRAAFVDHHEIAVMERGGHAVAGHPEQADVGGRDIAFAQPVAAEGERAGACDLVIDRAIPGGEAGIDAGDRRIVGPVELDGVDRAGLARWAEI